MLIRTVKAVQREIGGTKKKGKEGSTTHQQCDERRIIMAIARLISASAVHSAARRLAQGQEGHEVKESTTTGKKQHIRFAAATQDATEAEREAEREYWSCDEGEEESDKSEWRECEQHKQEQPKSWAQKQANKMNPGMTATQIRRQRRLIKAAAIEAALQISQLAPQTTRKTKKTQ